MAPLAWSTWAEVALRLGVGGFYGSLRLIAALGTHHTFVVEVVHTLECLMGDVVGGLGLLQQFEGTTDGLLAGTVVGHLVHCRGSPSHALGLGTLGLNLRGIKDGEGVAGMHKVTFLYTEFEDAAGHLARHTIFRHFHLTLNNVFFFVKSEITDNSYSGHGGDDAQNGQQNVVVLVFC